MGRKSIYNTEEERKAAQREAVRRWKKAHPEYFKQWEQEHKEEIAEYQKQYNKTPMGRALYLLQNYRRDDRNNGRGECTIPNAQWIVENIFTKPCHWCGETDWHKLGCDRIDNSLPHTPDNVIPCCEECNKKRGKKSYEEFKEALRAEEID